VPESSDTVKQPGGESSRLGAETSDDGSQSDQNGSEADVAVADKSAADNGDATVKAAGSEAGAIDHEPEQAKDEQVNESDTPDEARTE